MPPVHVHLVRHGQSTWNAERRLQGQVVHPPLTDRGRREAAAAGAALVATIAADPGRAELWSSDLVRAAQTAALIGARLRLPVHHDEALREQSLGSLEGRLSRDLRAQPTPPGQHVGDIRWGGGESTADVYARVGRYLARELATATADPRHGIRHLVLVSHGDTIRVARAWLLGRDHRDLDWDDLPNGSITSVTWTD